MDKSLPSNDTPLPAASQPPSYKATYAAPSPLGPPQPPNFSFGLQVQAHNSAVPSAAELAAYAHIDKSYPERIIALAEANAATERKTKDRAQELQWREGLLSRLLGFFFAISAIAAVVLLGLYGHENVAMALAAALAATTYAIVSRTSGRKE